MDELIKECEKGIRTRKLLKIELALQSDTGTGQNE